jgi:8-oxo-dGTP pyrophosphatase MutT (NUDIX family)
MAPEQAKIPWQTLGSKPVYDNNWISVREDDIIAPDGNPGIYGVVHFKNQAIGVLALDADGSVYLVGQYRYPLQAYSWEIPEGGCPEGELPLDAAKRELEEETGLSAAHWQHLGESKLSNSVSDEHAVFFLATGLTQGKAHPEGTEDLVVRKVSFEQALNMVLNAEITDAVSQLAILCYAAARSRNSI